MIDLGPGKRDMLRYVQDVRVYEGLIDGEQGHFRTGRKFVD